MALKDIQLAEINPVDRATAKFEVVVRSDGGKQRAIFDCDSERDAIELRNAIRQYASRLRRVSDFSRG